MSLSGLAPIDQSLLPAEVRTGSPERRRAYEAALGFERQLVQQMAKAMTDALQPIAGDGEDGDAGSAATKAYADLLPDTLADAVMAGGGLGLARTLDTDLRR